MGLWRRGCIFASIKQIDAQCRYFGLWESESNTDLQLFSVKTLTTIDYVQQQQCQRDAEVDQGGDLGSGGYRASRGRHGFHQAVV